MKNYYLFTTYILALLAIDTSQAQQKHYTKLEIMPKEIFVVGADNIIYADTLIMHDKSTIRFSADRKGTLLANSAYIGENVTIASLGTTGANGKLGLEATNGTNGGDLEINMRFITLGDLTIDTRGGAGGNGYIGKKGGETIQRSYQKAVKDSNGSVRMVTEGKRINTRSQGEPGSMNGLGGNGGSVNFTYATTDFEINVEQNGIVSKKNKKHIVKIKAQGGKKGIPGKDGSSTLETQPQSNRYDIDTSYGSKVSNTLVLPQDGTIIITNAKAESSK